MDKPLAQMTKKEFVFECSARALAGSFANPASPASVARLVRDAEKLWEELYEWEQLQEH